MKKISRIFYLNQWKKSASKKFFFRKSLIDNKIINYADSNNNDIQKTILSAKIGLKNNKELKFTERKKFLYKIYTNIKKKLQNTCQT